jgi:cell division protein FtsB
MDYLTLISTVGGVILGSVLTYITANKKNRRDDFVALVEALRIDNADLRQRISALEAELARLRNERMHLAEQIGKLQTQIHLKDVGQ